MKISVITVCYNAASHIEGCLRSVAEQTHDDVEHIVIDGLSRDGTAETVRRYPHVARLISERDRGIYDAMNKGLDLVTGDYVLFLNADDRFASASALAKAVAAIRSDPGGDVYYGSLEVRSLDGMTSVFHPPPPAEAPWLMICGCLPHQSTLARPSVFGKTGRFDLRYRYHADYDWFLKVLADRSVDVRIMHAVIGSFLMGGVSSQLAKGQPEVFAIQNESPLYASPDWDKKRIAALQEALLGERVVTARLRDEIHTVRERAHRLRAAYAIRVRNSDRSINGVWRVIAAQAALAGEVTRDKARAWLPISRNWSSRSWGWMIQTCVRYLPAGVVNILRRVRSRGRRRCKRDSASAGDPNRFTYDHSQDR